MSRVLIMTLLAATLTALLSGCENHSSNEWERLVCEVESINGGQPLISAYINLGADALDPADDSYPIDWVPVVFRARPYNSTIVLPEDGPHSWFHVTSYDLTWHPGPSCPPEVVEGLAEYNVVDGPCEAIVPVHDMGQVSILIADRTMKEQPWFQALNTQDGHSYNAACELTFRGHESGNSQVVTINSGFMVTFWGAIMEN